MDKNTVKQFIFILIVGLALLPAGSAVAQQSLYRDAKANQVGDIITVLLRENISGSTSSGAKTTSNADGSTAGQASGNFLPFQPTFGSGVKVNYDSDESMRSSQGQLLKGYMSVQIVEKTPSGDLIVEGKRMTEINGEKHKMSLRGTVRPRDIDSHNRVYSYRVANAEISYEKEEGLARLKRKRGLVKKAVFLGVGVAVGAAIMMNK